MVGQMFVKGKFRRIIDAETRLLDLEAALTKAADVHDCWTTILLSSKEFGFHSVRMNIAGMVFEDSRDNRGPEWQLRIPLPRAQYINFSRDFNSDVNPLILSAFVSAVERGLKEMVGQPPEVIRMPVPELTYAASAGAGLAKSSTR